MDSDIRLYFGKPQGKNLRMKTLTDVLERREKPSGIYHYVCSATVQDIRRSVETARYQFLYIDGDGVTDHNSFFDHASTAMNFPQYFGRNWDAFFDCVSDLSWFAAPGYVLLYDRFEKFAQNDCENFSIAVRCLGDAGDVGGSTTPLYVLLRGDAEAIANLPLQLELFG